MVMKARAELAASSTLAGAFATRARVELARAVMDALAAGDIDSEQGRASLKLTARCPAVAAIPDATRNQRVNTLLAALEQHHWVTRTIRGKRTYRIALGPELPDDWQLPGIDTAEVEPEPEREPEHPEDADAREEVGGRPGRFVARLQRELPTMIANAVTVALAEQRRIELAALGYVPASEQRDADTTERDELAARIVQLEDQLRAERAAAHQAREEANRMLSRSVTVERSPLRPHDLHRGLRELATHAIANGWTIHRSNGGHIAFKNPEGQQSFTSSTPSDWRTVRNFRAYLESIGLPE